MVEQSIKNPNQRDTSYQASIDKVVKPGKVVIFIPRIILI